MKSLKKFLEEATTQSSIPADTGVHVKKKLPTSDGQAAGCPYFDCDHGVFTRAVQGRAKHARWSGYINDESLTARIKDYKKSYPKKKILLKNSTTGEFMFTHKQFS